MAIIVIGSGCSENTPQIDQMQTQEQRGIKWKRE